MRIAAGTVIATKYRLEAQLARGGMGSVWVARHVTLGSQLAVKFLDPRLAASTTFVMRFEHEARAAASIQSPHVVHVQDFGVEEGTPYLVMELLHGEDLRTRLRRRGRLTLAESAEILVQVGKGLRRAHAAGIVHRDIKPGNLFLARVDDDEVLKVLDFGIAKQPAGVGEATITGEIVGTAYYVSPEQARGDRDVDHRTDVWATGVIAYRMVTGQLPFPGDGFGNVLAKVLTEPPPRVRSLVPSLPDRFDVFFARALAKNREQRFQTVRELVDAFVTIAGRESLEDSISPPSWSSIVHLPSLPSVPTVLDGAAGAGGAPPSLPRDTLADEVEVEVDVDGAPPDPASPWAPKHDSLSPQTSPGNTHFRASSRFRWAAAGGLVGIAIMGTVLAWLRQDPAPPPGAAVSATLPAPVDPGHPSSAGVTPAINPSPPPQASMTAPFASSSASAALRPATAPPASPAPSKPTSGPRRKWGF